MTELPTIKVIELGGFTLDVDHYLRKEYSDVGEALVELPAIIEWINEQLQSMIEAREMAKCKVKQCEAAAWFELKGGAFEAKGYSGKPTDGSIERAVELDAEVQKAGEELAILLGWVSRLTNLLDTFRIKFDLIRSTEATRRKQYDEQ